MFECNNSEVELVSCTYYWWNNHYACRKSGKDVDEDTYYKYCRNYDYDRCPIYKQELPTDSRCFISTACIRSKGLPDSCHELETLRWYRDNILVKSKAGQKDVTEYYALAPKIVTAIDASSSAEEVYSGIYNNLIIPCVRLIEQKEYDAAYDLYKTTVDKLKREFL